MRVRLVAFLGVGGVGKTTIIMRLIGLDSVEVRATLRPGLYSLFLDELGDEEVLLFDPPGQVIEEVVGELAQTWRSPPDLIAYVYDLTDSSTLDALYRIHERVVSAGLSAGAYLVIGNKRDLAEEMGILVDGSDFAAAVGGELLYVSAVTGDVERVREAVGRLLSNARRGGADT